MKILLKMLRCCFYLLVSATFLLGALWYWQKPLAQTGLSLYLKIYCRSTLGGEFSSEKIEYVDGTWTIYHPQIIGLDANGHEKGCFSADSTVIALDMSNYGLSLDLDVSIISPEIAIGKEAPDMEALLASLLAKTWPFEVFGKISATEGLFSFPSQTQKGVRRHVYFDLSAEGRDQSIATHLAVSLDATRSETHPFEISISHQKEDQFDIQMACRDADCAIVWQSLCALYPPLGAWTLDQGRIDGEVDLVIPLQGAPYAEGVVEISDFAFEYHPLEMEGEVAKARLVLHQHEKEAGFGHLTTIGRFEFSEEASVMFRKGGDPFWEVQNLQGDISFDVHDYMALDLEGRCFHQEQDFCLQMKGRTRYSDDTQSSLDLTLALGRPGEELSSAHFTARQMGKEWENVQISLSNVGFEEFACVQAGVEWYFPSCRNLEMLRGTLDASVIAHLENGKWAEVRIDTISANDVAFAFKNYGLLLNANKISGALTFDLQHKNILESLNGSFTIKKGEASMVGTEWEAWELYGMNTELAIRNGIVQKSTIEGQFAGLFGTVTIDPLSPDECLLMEFNGGTEGLIALLPEHLQERLLKQMRGDTITLEVGVSKSYVGIQANGALHFEEGNTPEGDTIRFGFDLSQTSEQLFGQWPLDPVTQAFLEKKGRKALQTLLPSVASMTALVGAEWLRQELGHEGFVLHSGWFEAERLAVDKYVAPFVFTDDTWTLRGEGDFKGTFDHTGTSLLYSARNLEIDTPNFTLFIPKVTSEKKRNSLPAHHTFDLGSGQHYGQLPIQGSTYIEKNSGLVFNEIDAQAVFEGGHIHFYDLATVCQGIFFNMEIDVDYTRYDAGYCTIGITSDFMDGKLSQVSEMLHQINPELLAFDIPIEGDVLYRQQGGSLTFDFTPETWDAHYKVDGRLVHGELKEACTPFFVRDLSLNFSLDKGAKTLHITDLHALLDKGEDASHQPLSLVSDQIVFTDLPHGALEFDLWVGDKQRDVLRIKGSTTSKIDAQGEEEITFLFDPQVTHFGTIHPTTYSCVLRNWTDVALFDLAFSLNIESFVKDLQILSSAGALPFPINLEEGLETLEVVKGSFSVGIHYDAHTARTDFKCEGEEIFVGETPIHTWNLQGYKRGEVWTVEEWQLDHLSLAADFFHQNAKWRFNFLGARYRDTALIGLEGEYNEKEQKLAAKVNLLDIDLTEMTKWPELAPHLSAYPIEGKMRGSGAIEATLTKGKPKWSVGADFTVRLQAWGLKGLKFGDADQIQCHYDDEKGLVLSGLRTSLLSPDDTSVKGNLVLNQFHYDLTHREYRLDGLRFHLPIEHLSWVTSSLQTAFPDQMQVSVAEYLLALKKGGALDGVIDYEFASSYSAFTLTLDDGNYWFNGQEHPTRGFRLEFDPFQFKVLTQYHVKNAWLWMLVHSTHPTLDSGSLVLATQNPEFLTDTEVSPLTAEWEIHPLYGFYIKAVQGELLGLKADLKVDDSMPLSDAYLALKGEVHADWTQALPLLEPAVVEAIEQWEVGAGYTLRGNWLWDTRSYPDLPQEPDRLSFNGSIEGKNCSLCGYYFQNLKAQVAYTPGTVEVEAFSIGDRAGVIEMPQVRLVRDDTDAWFMTIPLIEVKNMHMRYLQMVNPIPRKDRKSMIVRHLYVRDLNGYVADHTTYTGVGALHFVNPPKKSLKNTIFAVPAEIISRLGLDLSVLTPVTGTIQYTIADGKVQLTKFKDVYSEGKMSKFYLSNTGYPSYMDFDWNLHVQIRMKHYNLLFKLAELFTVTVRGTLDEPKYTLQRQNEEKGRGKPAKRADFARIAK